MDAIHDPGATRARARIETLEDAAAQPIAVEDGGTIRIGTASWTDPTMTAGGVFYPARADTAEERLQYYAARFPVVEVDATYYALPAVRTSELWVERTPPDFTFNIKAHALMTGQPTEPKRLPKAITVEQVDKLLSMPDNRDTLGARDRAILETLYSTGVRVSELVDLNRNDLDHAEQTLRIRGKGKRTDRLPLPTEVGQALAAYLRRGRRQSDCRSLFLRARAPYSALDRGGITAIVYRACKRADLPVVGAHRLRHSSATLMLRKGATLDDISQVLRHRHPATTAIYAKVDHRRLRELAQPWPGGAA